MNDLRCPLFFFIVSVIQSVGCSQASAGEFARDQSGRAAIHENRFEVSQIERQYFDGITANPDGDLVLAVGITLVVLLVILIALLIRINLQRAQVANDLRKRFEQRTLDLVQSKKQLVMNNLASEALSSSVSKKLTAIAATLNGIQHLESVDRTEISSHLAAIVDDIREVTRMLHKEHETPT